MGGACADPEMIRAVKADVARAKNHLKKDRLLEAFLAGARAFRGRAGKTFSTKDRTEIEFGLMEFCDDCLRNWQIRRLAAYLGHNPEKWLRFAPKSPIDMAERFQAMHDAVVGLAETKAKNEALRKEATRDEWFALGKTALTGGNLVKARIYFKRLCDDYAEEPGLLTKIAALFVEHDLTEDGRDLFERALTLFPADPEPYRALTALHKKQREFDKAAELYERALKQFGMHPQTLVNLALLYLDWGKKDLAADSAKRALAVDPEHAQARRIWDEYS